MPRCWMWRNLLLRSERIADLFLAEQYKCEHNNHGCAPKGRFVFRWYVFATNVRRLQRQAKISKTHNSKTRAN
jgi:hypothetical protein